jgi:hypothetical protein
MFGIVMLAALAGAGESAALYPGCYGCGYGGGGVYEHGYGYFRPVTVYAGGVVYPPSWFGDVPSIWEDKIWADYVFQLEGHERADMICVWDKATPEARRVLLQKLVELRIRADMYRAKVEMERALEKAKEENRPLTEDEQAVWERYIDKLKGEKKAEALKKWKEADNRGKRQMLKELPKSEDE